MIIEAIYHEPDSNLCYPVSTRRITLRLRVAAADNFEQVKVIYGEKYTYHMKQQEIPMQLKYNEKYFKYYEVAIDLSDVRFVYVFEITENGKKYYFSEDGISTEYDFKLAYYNCFQYPYINEVDLPKKIDWLDNTVFYEIFVDRFFQGDFEKDQSYINEKWNNIPKPKSFYGGDLKGIIEKLDYLKELGINALYLTPIFSSISNHKYDINDYYMIDKQFGTDKIFKELVTKAHSMGIRVVLDAVFNHSSNLIMQFQDVVKKGKKSPYFDWFIIHGDEVDEKACNYETFSNCYYHPKFNTSNKEVRDFLIGIGKYYVKEFDIDGWRLDVADELSHNFWREFREELKNIKPDFFLVGENWHNSYPFLRGDQFDAIMNYAFTKTVLDYLAYETKDAKETSYKFNNLLIRNNEIVNDMMLNLLDSHDTDRFYTYVKKNLDKLMCGLAIQFVFKGVPGLYYGIEMPLEGGYDPDNRRCMDWDNLGKNSEYFAFLKALIAIKRNNVCLQKGDIKIYEKMGMLVIERYTSKEWTYLYINNTKDNVKLNINGNVLLSNKYDNNIIKPNGLVIFSEDK